MDKPVVEVDTTIAADPGAVWAAMTARQSAMFPGTTVETDWVVGHPITFSGEWNGKPFKDRGEIESVEEGRELSFTHWSELSGQPDRPENYHVVRYRLDPQGDRTKVSLAQFNRGSKTDIDAGTRADYEKNWRMMLDSLKNAVEKH
ncbi:SRPBCC family protein [Devosia nitrariae]|uniref:Activator of Hsp90 ATPase homologue 1/2-like C-terminal domain-containing protein n=1 Tax=Devosia nitrariae TaxID=2071872 RepID=A0ABQ5WBT7_9HYPH|nr:SRPBCC domain-containing protein [Devosia nitrariae]GLQ57307.1 hypothetical protein GCM10010862_45660 [Devosia nitrariae]